MKSPTLQPASKSLKIGILSDAHGNGPAFLRSISILRSFGANHFWYLGDAIGYIPSVDVIDSIISLGSNIQCTKGNHERMFLSGNYLDLDDHVYGFSELTKLVTQQHNIEISSWVESIRQTIEGKSVFIFHGSPLNFTDGYVYEETDISGFNLNDDFVFMGNTHRPFIRKVNNTTFVNVGSCGLPRDFGNLASVALFEPAEGNVRILRFDIEKETELALSTESFVHESVKKLFNRREDYVFGEQL